jgi:hypothetical protein
VLDELDLPTCSLIAGWVVDETGRGVKGANLTLTGLNNAVLLKSKTGRKGYFQIEASPKTTAVILDRHRWHLHLSATKKGQEAVQSKVFAGEIARLTLAPRSDGGVHALLTGHVRTKEGKPVAGATVVVFDPENPAFVRQAEADRQGRYALLLINAPASTEVAVTKPGSVRLQAELEFDPMLSEHVVGLARKDFELVSINSLLPAGPQR